MINKRKTNLDIYLTTLTKTLISSRKNEKNSLREQISKAINISINSNSSFSATFISYQLPLSLSLYLYYSYRDLYHSSIYYHHQEYSSHISISSQSNIVVSFPIAFEIEDNRDKLTNYFNWLVVVYLAMEKQLQKCFLMLKSEEIVYETLLNVPKAL